MYFRVFGAMCICLVTAFSLAACTTNYRPQGFIEKIRTDGFNFRHVGDGTLFRAQLNATIYTDINKMRQMMALFAAEHTLRKGSQYYMFLQTKAMTRRSLRRGTIVEDALNGTLNEVVVSYSNLEPHLDLINGGNAPRYMKAFVLPMSEAEAKRAKNVPANKIYNAKKIANELKPVLDPPKQAAR